MSNSLHEVVITHVGLGEERVICGWVYGPKEGVLHLHEVETPNGRDTSRAVVLANVVGYTTRRLR